MDVLFKLTDEDIGYEYHELENPELRLAARGIVVRDDGKIAVFNKSNKNEYKLPGGGMEEDENPEEAFKREVLEETGCIIEITHILGTTEEYKAQSNFKQISYIFVGKVIEDTLQVNFTKKEKDEGAKLIWETPEKALELITDCYDKLVDSDYENVYATKFVVLRDRKLLEFYMNNF
jgi:8-oxo-dGTP diphosphatase